jgi:hypothetical protein
MRCPVANASRSAVSAASPCISARRAWAAIPRPVIPVALPGKYVPYFKPGKELRDRVNGIISSDTDSD